MNRTLKEFPWETVGIIILAGALLFHQCTPHAHGQDKTALHLAQCLRSETDKYHGPGNVEWAAHAWVLRKRAVQKGVSLNEMVLQYCAIFDKRSPAYYGQRANAIRRSSFSRPLHGKKAEWVLLRKFVWNFLLGDVIKDPCPSAMHFGTESDVGGKALVEVCKWLGKRGNKFFRVGG